MNSQGGSSQEMAISIKNLKELSLSDIGKPLRKEDDGNLKKTPSDKMNSSSTLQAQGDCAVESNEGITISNKRLKVFSDSQKPLPRIKLSCNSQKFHTILPASIMMESMCGGERAAYRKWLWAKKSGRIDDSFDDCYVESRGRLIRANEMG